MPLRITVLCDRFLTIWPSVLGPFPGILQAKKFRKVKFACMLSDCKDKWKIMKILSSFGF